MATGTGWFKGVVKEIVSGDTLVIAANVAKTTVPPPEKRLTLSSLMAPKLVRLKGTSVVRVLPALTSFVFDFQGKRDGSTRDEAFAWQSREFLRKRAIGQVPRRPTFVAIPILLASQIFSGLISRPLSFTLAASCLQD